MSVMVHLPRCDGVWHLTEMHYPSSFPQTKIRPQPSYQSCTAYAETFFYFFISDCRCCWNNLRSHYVLVCTYKVNTPPTLDICLTVVSIEYCEEPFKGIKLSCSPGLACPSIWFDESVVSVFSAWICTVVWQVNGAQQQTPCYDLQSDLIFASGCYTDWIFG